ncbi:unnamed protein product [Gongylonema pulchrum]|uniref:Ovule protein n=1 Tax=Gongylonema pulchrum TaxID=637853 RepID=A0A183EE27_9BILA|nr:unnamed protein product [Gongylonema pulchrum]
MIAPTKNGVAKRPPTTFKHKPHWKSFARSSIREKETQESSSVAKGSEKEKKVESTQSRTGENRTKSSSRQVLPDFLVTPPTTRSELSFESRPVELKDERTQSARTQPPSLREHSHKKSRVKTITSLSLEKCAGYITHSFSCKSLTQKNNTTR